MIFGGGPVSYPRSVIDEKLASLNLKGDYVPLSGGTIDGNLTVTGTLSTTLLEALSANITVIDIKQYELSGFNVQGNATVQGNISATGNADFGNTLRVAAAGIDRINPQISNSGFFYGYGNSSSVGVGNMSTGVGIRFGSLGNIAWGGGGVNSQVLDLILARDAANTLAQRNGTASQTSRIYNTYTDANNYQRGIFTWLSGASAFVIGTESSTTAGVSALSGLVNPIILAPGYNQSLSATAPVILRQTWNNSANAFTLLSANVTDTASSASSNLLDLQVNGVSQLRVDKAGEIKGPINKGAINLSYAGAFAHATWNGVSVLQWTSSTVNATTTRIRLGEPNYVYLQVEGVDTLALRNANTGLNPQTLRLYNTYTDASNYERLGIIWSSNTATIRTESAGSGSGRSLVLGVGNGAQWFINSAGGHLQTYGSDGIYDIGAPSSNRPRNIYITGHLAASTKSFKIPHQTKSGYLQYGVVESDQHSVFVRGKTSDDTITLPDHWDWLVDEDSVTVQLTPIGKPMSLFVIEQNNKTVKVGGVEGNYNYTIYGTRKDVPDLIVETEE